MVLGVVDAKYNSPNTRFMILTKAFSEARILLNSLGGAEDTLFLACGFGDFCLTSLNDLSRNRTLGLLIGKGFFSLDYKFNSVILEGLNAIEMFHALIEKDMEKTKTYVDSLRIKSVQQEELHNPPHPFLPAVGYPRETETGGTR